MQQRHKARNSPLIADVSLAECLEALPSYCRAMNETYPLEKAQTTIGRSPDCDIFLDDVTVSRRHAVVGRGDAGFTIEDLGSLNGTFLNRSRIERGGLDNGDEVQIGKYRLIFLAR